MNISSVSKEKILTVCQNIVKTKGLSAVSMRSVASDCGVAVGSIYNYFPSKAELLFAAIESVWKDIFHTALEQVDFESFAECLCWMFDRIITGGQKYPEFFSVHALSFNSEDKAIGREIMEKYMVHLKYHLSNALEKDMNVREDAFNDTLTSSQFVDYIFTLFISSVMKPNKNCDALLQIVSRCLY